MSPGRANLFLEGASKLIVPCRPQACVFAVNQSVTHEAIFRAFFCESWPIGSVPVGSIWPQHATAAEGPEETLLWRTNCAGN